MITPYVRPQATITQILQRPAVRAASRRNPVVIGPQYNLYLNDGRDLSPSFAAFNSAGAADQLYLDENGVALDIVRNTPRAASAQLFGKDLEALVATFTGTPNIWSLDAADPTARTIRIGADGLAGAGVLNAGLNGRPVRVGDTIASTWATASPSATGSTRRKVVGLAGKVTPAVVPSQPQAGSPLNPVTQASSAAVAVAAETTVGLAVTSAATVAAADINLLRAAGKTALISGSYKLIDQLDIVCVVGGAAGTATFNVTSLATGITTAAPVTSVSDSGYKISLVDAGYAGPSNVIITRTGNVLAGERIRVLLQPAFTAAALSALPISGSYTPTVDRRYALEVVAHSGTTYDLKIYDVTGADPEVQYTAVVAAGALAIGSSGLTVDPDNTPAGFCKGQVFYVDVTAAKTSVTEFTGLVLDGPAVPTVAVSAAGGAGSVTFTSTSIHQVYSGLLAASNTSGAEPVIDATVTNWSYPAGLGLPSTATGRAGIAFSSFVNGFGSVYVSYKALVKPSPTEGVISISRESDLPDLVGETGIENWLGRGALEAFRGNQNRVVYALRTGGDTVEDFRAALRKIQTTDNVYALVGLTDNLDVMQLIRDHCVTMSDKYHRNFRRAYVGTDSPGAYVHWGVLTGGGYRTGDLVSSVVTLDADYRATSQFVAADVGSSITIQSIGQTYNILEVLSDFEVLTDAPEVLTALGSNLVLTRADTPANAALFVSARSQALGSRRIVNVWCDDPVITENGVTKVLPMKFVAAEIAGLRCALLPQQGLTMTEVLSVVSAPSMYTSFDPEELDAVAASGTFVITQESGVGDVFVRHQLTTSTLEGALAYEDNVGVIVDEFSYAVKDAFRDYIGRRNATPDTISEIDDKLKALATDFTQVELTNANIGPAVLAFFDEKGNEGEVTVRQDGDLADTLLTYVLLRVPLPIRGINHYIDVDVTDLLPSADN